MKLKKITIENFRCFESLTLDFEKDVNVIVGVNGAGKSSLLDAIALALSEITITPNDVNNFYAIKRNGKQVYYERDTARQMFLRIYSSHFKIRFLQTVLNLNCGNHLWSML
jgi:predicted ATP-dependent endonuclease of OLD family